MKTAHKTLVALFIGVWALVTVTALQLATPCRTEDSTMCYWDAATRSNGHGISFIALWDTDIYIITEGK